jgi:anti-anti-sigma factor
MAGCLVVARPNLHCDAVDLWQWDAHEPPTGTITVEQGADGPVLHLRGDVDAPVVQRWRAERPDDGAAIVAVDVAEVSFIDSTALALLAKWAQDRSRAGRPAVIRHVGRRFEQVLGVSGLDSMFVRDG